MNVATQISGNIQPDNKALFALKSMLAHIGINVTHPTSDESLFYSTDTGEKQAHYENELAFYRSIAHSSFHIIYNDAPITRAAALPILYAMLNNRPILMTGAPVFAGDIDLFARETILQHMPAFHSVNLPELELAELSLLLQKLKPFDYRLSKQEQVLISARVRQLFRTLS